MSAEAVTEKMEAVSVNEAAPAPVVVAPKKEAPAPKTKHDFVLHRLRVFDEVKAELAKQIEEKPIKITLPDGSVRDGIAGKTTPLDIATAISNKLAQDAVVAKVNGELQMMTEPMVADSQLVILDFDSPEGRHVMWHSGAHVLGEAMERLMPCDLCVGPPLDDKDFDTGGFFYEAFTRGRKLDAEDLKQLEKLANEIIKEKQQFERIQVPKEKALEMFKYNPYKLHLLSTKVPDGTNCSVFRCGDLVDPCRGPHIPHTGRLKFFSITKNSSSYWLGNAANDSLQRVYAITFPEKDRMRDFKKLIEEAEQRDHRNVGKVQELFFFHDYSPGAAFFLPHGARIYNRLMAFLRSEYHRRGYEEVITPNVFNCKLWETSGHWAHYQENMFTFTVDDSPVALKPMNCPSHCLMFGHRVRSWRELPIRFADFGVLHRNELSGALSGLTRVRRFQQDDAHIFCREDQIEDEVNGVLQFLQCVYEKFGFTFQLRLSTRPEKYLGALETWDRAEAQLKEALNRFGQPWELNPGDGAFYGPKIDITLQDSLRRKHQCATVQLDFQLPIRFGLQYMGRDDDSATSGDQQALKRPVIIHRALYGSLERFFAIIIESTGGKWPFWLSPRQAIVLTVSEKFDEYAHEARDQLHNAGFHVDLDLSNRTLMKKVREAQLSQYNYILVVGQEEVEKKTVNVRTRDNVVRGSRTLVEMIEEFKTMDATFQ